jgi:glutamyl-tRNA synthetase
MAENVRVRYAPSPTGFPHVGNIRTALFNWIFARHAGGTFTVRIEDTDVARTVPGALEGILDGLRWLGLDWDEGPEIGGEYGPYFQSQRLPLYKQAAERLISQGDAYYCFCSPERLETMRAEQARRKVPPGYDRHCRNLTPEQIKEQQAKGIIPVVRFKMPLTGQTEFDDIIRGRVRFENSTIDDFVLLKSDGYPTYHLASIVDDHAMHTSHVIRGEEWLSSTPRHILLYRAMGYQPPFFAHLPMILGPDRAKLSKRHGATSITEYRDQGFLPEAMFNFLALLGWSLDDKTEIISRDELVKNFSLERISQTAAIFNQEKLAWMNGIYIRQLSAEEFVRRALPFLESGLPASIKRPLDPEYIRKVMPLIQERVRLLTEVAELSLFFFEEKLEYEPSMLIEKKMDAGGTLRALEVSMERLVPLESFEAGALEAVLRPLAEELGLKAGQLFGTLRVATTGRAVAPPLFETMAILGKERTLERIRAAIEKIEKLAGKG